MNDERIFTEDIEVPGIVTQKAEAAFAQIRKDGTKSMKKTTKKKLWKTPAAVAASICLVLVGGITVTAAVQHFWGNAIEQELQGTDEQWQDLEKSGVAIAMANKDMYKDLAVTNQGVTITPCIAIADENFARVSFYIEGYELPENMEPEFSECWAYTGDDPEHGGLTWNWNFFNGITESDTDAYYLDGSPAEVVDGAYVCHYMDKDGKIELSAFLQPSEVTDSFIGETIHFEFKNLGYWDEKTEKRIVDVKGTWAVDVPLSEQSVTKEIQMDKKIEGSVFTLKSVKISPISVVAYMKANGTVENENDDLNLMNIKGLLLKDGSELNLLKGGEDFYRHYDDGTRGTAIEAKMSLDQIIDPENVRGIVLRSDLGKEYTVEFDN